MKFSPGHTGEGSKNPDLLWTLLMTSYLLTTTRLLLPVTTKDATQLRKEAFLPLHGVNVGARYPKENTFLDEGRHMNAHRTVETSLLGKNISL